MYPGIHYFKPAIMCPGIHYFKPAIMCPGIHYFEHSEIHVHIIWFFVAINELGNLISNVMTSFFYIVVLLTCLNLVISASS